MNNYFDRAAIKERAKAALRKCYWLAFGVAAIVSLILGELPTVSFNFDLSDLSRGEVESFESYTPFAQQAPSFGSGGDMGMPAVVGIAVVMLVLVLVLAVVLLGATLVKSFFLDGAVAVGGSRFFLSVTRGEAKFSDVLAGFKHNYFNVCKVMFARVLKLLLWELFLLIPMGTAFFGAGLAAGGLEFAGLIIAILSFFGILPAMIPCIIKSYEYSMIPYLLAEFPEMSAKDAFAASKDLTDGHKGELFVLELSFLGWELLGILCFGIGGLFLAPYVKTSWAEAYAELCRLKFPPAPTPFEPIEPVTAEPVQAPEAESAPATEQPIVEADNDFTVSTNRPSQTEE